MDEKEEYNRIADGLRDHLELLISSGITFVRAPGYPSAQPSRPEGQGATQATGAASSGLEQRVRECAACVRAAGQKKAGPGKGPRTPSLVFVVGAPVSGAEEELLTKMIEAMGFKRESVYVTHSVRCASPEEPTDEDVASCKGFLAEELASLGGVRTVVALGAVAALALLGSRDTAGLRGRFHEFRGLQVMPTHGTGELLGNPAVKKEAWEDLKTVIKELSRG